MKNKTFRASKWLVIIYLCLTVVMPLAFLFANISGESFKEVFSSVQFLPMLKNSVITTLAATLISVSISFALAWIINRSNIKFKSIFVVLFTIPMLIPSISHGMGLVFLFGDNGLITNLLGINIGLYGYTGIIMGSVLYSFPVSFLMLNDTFRYEDFTTYEAAGVLGLSKWKQFCAITLPSMKRPLISATLAVFTMVFTDYGVPLMTGGMEMTLPVYMYREVIGLMNFSNGSLVGIVLLAPAVIAFILDMRNHENAGGNSITRPFEVHKSVKRDTISYIACIVTVICVCLPIAAFALLSFVKQYPIDMSFSLDNVHMALSGGIGMYLLNSLAIALLTALVGTSLSYFSAYITARSSRNISTKMLHFISMLSLAIPGIVLGLSYSLAFKKMPFYSTIFILVMVNIVHFFSSPYLLAYNSLTKFNANLEDVSATLGIGKFRMLSSVYIPCTLETIIEMYSYFFVNAMITISAVSFLVNFRTMPLALMIPQLEAQSFIEGTALISLIILVLNLFQKLVVYLLKRSRTKTGNV